MIDDGRISTESYRGVFVRIEAEGLFPVYMPLAYLMIASAAGGGEDTLFIYVRRGSIFILDSEFWLLEFAQGWALVDESATLTLVVLLDSN